MDFEYQEIYNCAPDDLNDVEYEAYYYCPLKRLIRSYYTAYITDVGWD